MSAVLPGQLLSRNFFTHGPVRVARALLGKLLVRAGDVPLAGRVVETEAYLGNGDPAAHAFTGKTPRNAVLFGPPGHAYVYFVYGMHYCLNVSCEPEGSAGCVLIRALEPVAGMTEMARARGLHEGVRPGSITGGPARLCQAFGITRERDNGIDMTSAASALQWRDDSYECGVVDASPRVGIRKAVEMPLRFHLRGNACISR